MSLTRHQVAVLLAMCQRERRHWRELDVESLRWHDHFALCPDCITIEQDLRLVPPSRLRRALVRLEGLGWILSCGVYHSPQGERHRAWITRWHPRLAKNPEKVMETLFAKPTICAGQLTPF